MIGAIAGCGVALGLTSIAAATGSPPALPKACEKAVLRQRPVHPKLLRSAPPAGLMSILDVLRRPASSSDVLPKGDIPTGYSAVWIRYVRYLATGPDHTRYFLIPGMFADPLPRVCRSTLSARQRRQEVRLDREERKGSVTVQAIYSHHAGEFAIPITPSEIGRGDVLIVPGASTSTASAYGIVPDGVSSVTVSGRGGRPVSSPVSANFFLMRVPLRFRRAAHGFRTERFTIRWYAADGTVAKTFSYRLNFLSESFP